LEALAVAVVRRGDWPRGLALLDRIPDNAARLAALDNAAAKAAEDSMSMDPGNPPPRGAPVDDIRRQAAGDHSRAVKLVENLPSGYQRARAWLAMAKGVIGPPANLPANVVESPAVSSGIPIGNDPADPTAEEPKKSEN
jgi:hypothetical protein